MAVLARAAAAGDARAKLGKMWGLDRPLRAAELGRLLRLKGRDPGESVLDWESGKPVSGPASVAIEMMLSGAAPPTLRESINGLPEAGAANPSP